MISYYNREKKTYETEIVAGEGPISWMYSTNLGMGLLEAVVKKRIFSSIYGKLLDSKFSKKKITPFVEEFSINQEESIDKLDEFKSFNEFFFRKLKKEARPIQMEDNVLISPGDGKIMAYKNINKDALVQIKGFTYSLKELINDAALSNKYNRGSMVVLRLSPTDYHRFHFMDSGLCEKAVRIKGYYYSVNPIALSKVTKLFCQNKRQYSIFHSKNFKDVLYVEVGATCVGSIIDTYLPDSPVERGDEKGYFKFGGSTVILFFQNNTINIDQDIMTHSGLGFETKVKLGEKIGIKI
jgi:phosphatidylserine decarboxylase